jgi:hypothetical protein
MSDNRIIFNGQEYEVMLTTKAMRDITRKFESIEKIGDVFKSSDTNQDDLLEVMVFLTYTLVNQAILRYNFTNPTEKKPLLTQEEVELFTGIDDLTTYLPIFTRVLSRDLSQKIKTEDEKNVVTAL